MLLAEAAKQPQASRTDEREDGIMKKLAVALLSAAMVLSLMGCTGKSTGEKKNNTDKTVQTETTDTEKESETDSSAVTEVTETTEQSGTDSKTQGLDYAAVYEPVLENYREQYGDDILYTMYDLDEDGAKELIVSYGTCMADWENTVYTYEASGAEEIGSFYAQVLLYQAEDGNGLYAVAGQMDEPRVWQITMQDGTLQKQNVENAQTEEGEDYYKNDHPVEFVKITDPSLLGQK